MQLLHRLLRTGGFEASAEGIDDTIDSGVRKILGLILVSNKY